MKKRSSSALPVLTAVTLAVLLTEGLAFRTQDNLFRASPARAEQATKCASPSVGSDHPELVQWKNATFYQLPVDSGVLKAGKYHVGVEKSTVCVPLTGELEVSSDIVFEQGDLLKIIWVDVPTSDVNHGVPDGVSGQMGRFTTMQSSHGE